MISLRKSITEDGETRETLSASVSAYLATLDHLQRYAQPFDEDFVKKFQHGVKGVAQQLERQISPNLLKQSAIQVGAELKTAWDSGRGTISKWREDCRSLVRVLSESARSLEVQDRGCNRIFQSFSERMRRLSESNDLNEIRGKLHSELATLKTSIDQMLSENRAITEGMRETVKHTEARFAQVEAIAFTDPLTGLPNRRQAEAIMAATLKSGDVWCVMLFDVDRFKSVNDTHGHACGDAVLTRVARILKKSVRSSDDVCRWAGDEFLAVLHCDLLAAFDIGETIASSWGTQRVEFAGKHADVPISVSWGVCQYLQGERLEAFIARADAEMYLQKASAKAPLK